MCISVGIPSLPEDYPFFNCLMAILTTATDGVVDNPSRINLCGNLLIRFSSIFESMFRILEKCSAQLLGISFLWVRRLSLDEKMGVEPFDTDPKTPLRFQ